MTPSGSIDYTHDPSRRSWVGSANTAGTDFPLQNLPFGVFRRVGTREAPRVGVAIGDYVFDVATALTSGCFDNRSHEVRVTARACAMPTLNEVMARGAQARRELRHAIFDLLDDVLPESHRQVVVTTLVPLRDAELLLPAQIGDYTDFYASVHHATNVGSMFRPDNPLLPNYKWVPIGYHGRASSIVVSGTPIKRPHGQLKPADQPTPTFDACRNLDFELEIGAFVGEGNALGESITLRDAESHLFGLCLLNDWSARDIQAWEYQPLGPFLAKNFASTISPWVVTMDALAPFRAPLESRATDDPPPLPYLFDRDDQDEGGFDISLEVLLSTAQMRAAGDAPVRIARSSALQLYWSIAQMFTHHTSNGCNMNPGDLLGTGTISGRERDSRGSMLEITWRGAEPLTLPNGEVRRFLENGDDVIFRGYCERDGFARIGFGECRGRVTA